MADELSTHEKMVVEAIVSRCRKAVKDAFTRGDGRVQVLVSPKTSPRAIEAVIERVRLESVELTHQNNMLTS
jgi:hypothetical protein